MEAESSAGKMVLCQPGKALKETCYGFARRSQGGEGGNCISREGNKQGQSGRRRTVGPRCVRLTLLEHF